MTVKRDVYVVVAIVVSGLRTCVTTVVIREAERNSRREIVRAIRDIAGSVATLAGHCPWVLVWAGVFY